MFNIDFYKDHEITTLSSHHAFLSPVVLLPFTLLILHWSRAFVNPLSVNASLFPQSEIRDPQFLSYRLLFTAFPQSEIAVPGLASFIICGNYFASVSPIQDKRDLYWIETL